MYSFREEPSRAKLDWSGVLLMINSGLDDVGSLQVATRAFTILPLDFIDGLSDWLCNATRDHQAKRDILSHLWRLRFCADGAAGYVFRPRAVVLGTSLLK